MPSNEPEGTKPKRFRIAFSFAGEKREFLAKVARIVADRFGEDEILYDKFHEAEFARRDLGIYLPELYHKESDLVVVVACLDYENKEWCGLEWTAIHALLKNRKDSDVMLTHFGRATIKGLYDTAGWIELDQKSPDQFATLILERLKANGHDIRKRRRSARQSKTTPSGAAVPNNLRRLPYFFGRTVDLERVAAALRPDDRTWIILIHGPGGIGKTAFAIRAAELARPEDYSRIVFVSSKRSELEPGGKRAIRDFLVSGYIEILNAIARELGDKKFGEHDEAQRSAELQKLLREERILLVIDNLESLSADDLGRVVEFLRNLPSGCKAIITSRRRTDIQCHLVTLGSIAWEDAQQLLTALERSNRLLANASEDQRRCLHHDCGGNPLILQWVVGQLGRGQCRTVASALNLLKESPAGQDALEFIFGDISKHFTPEEASLLAALSHFTLPIQTKHLAELADVSPLAAQPVLESLHDRALVVGDVEMKKFLLRPLVADFLRRTRPEVIQITGDRLEKQAYALVVENGYKNHDRFPLLDTAWATVAASLPRFLAGENARLQTVCAALNTFLEFTGRWDELLALERDAESRAVSEGNFDKAGWRAYQVGWVHYLREQSGEVLAYADRAEAHWRQAKGGIRETAFAIRLRGLGHELAKDYPAAADAYRDAIKLWRTMDRESEDVAIGLNDLAGAERIDRQFEAAERDYREALRIARAIDYHEGVATYTGNLAVLRLDRKDWSGAETLAREAMRLAEKIGRQELIAWTSHLTAKALIRQGRKEEALPHARRAAEIYQKLGSPDLAGTQQTLAECES